MSERWPTSELFLEGRGETAERSQFGHELGSTSRTSRHHPCRSHAVACLESILAANRASAA